jgi:hypothetical protein
VQVRALESRTLAGSRDEIRALKLRQSHDLPRERAPYRA